MLNHKIKIAFQRNAGVPKLELNPLVLWLYSGILLKGGLRAHTRTHTRESCGTRARASPPIVPPIDSDF